MITQEGFRLTLHSWGNVIIRFENAFCPNNMTMIAYDPFGNVGIMTFLKTTFPD